MPNLTENATLSDGDTKHSIYMVKDNLVTHSEDPTKPYYTPEGDAAARNANIEVNTTTNTTDDQAIDWWMQAPFHAMGMMDPRLQTTGFGSYGDSTSSPWHFGAAIDTSRGNPFSGGTYPVYFPGNGNTEPLTTYSGGEYPDPLQACPGYAVPTGLPVFIEVGGNVSTTATVHSFTGNGAPLNHCVIDSSNTALSSYLAARGGVIVIPQQPLQSGVKYVVALTVNGLPYTWSFTVGPLAVTPPPTGWSSVGGVLTSSPGASSWGATTADAFVRGTDNAMWRNTWNGTAWSGWTPLGGGLASEPGAVAWGSNRIDIFVRGTDSQLWHRWWDGAWRGWEPLGGILTSGPDVASWGPNRLDVFARGTDNGLWHRWWDGVAWRPWEPLGGGLTSDPGAVSSAANRVDVVVRGTDNAIWIKSWNGSPGWTAWTNLGGVATSSPTIASCTSGHLDIFVRGTDNALWQLGFNGTSWTVWKSLGGNWTSSPSAVCRAGTPNIDLYARFSDLALWTESVAGS